MERKVDISDYRAKFPPREHEEAVRMLLEGLDKEEIVTMQRRRAGGRAPSGEDLLRQRERRNWSQENETPRRKTQPTTIGQAFENRKQQQVAQCSSSSVDSADPLASCSDSERSESFERRDTEKQLAPKQRQRKPQSDAEDSPEESIQVSPQVSKKQAPRETFHSSRLNRSESNCRLSPRVQSKATSTSASESSSVRGVRPPDASDKASVDEDLFTGGYEAIPNRTIAVQCDLKASSVRRPTNGTGGDQLSSTDDSSADLASMQVSSISSTRYGFYKLSPETLEQRRQLARSISSRNIARSTSRLNETDSTESERDQRFEERSDSCPLEQDQAPTERVADARRVAHNLSANPVGKRTTNLEDQPKRMVDPNEGYDSELEIEKRRALAKKLLPQTKTNNTFEEQKIGQRSRNSEDELSAVRLRRSRATSGADLSGRAAHFNSNRVHSSLPRRPRTAMSFVTANKLHLDASPNSHSRQPTKLSSSRDRAMSQQVLNSASFNQKHHPEVAQCDFGSSNSDGELRDETNKVPFNEEIVVSRRRVCSPLATPMSSSDNEHMVNGITRNEEQQPLRRSATLKATNGHKEGTNGVLGSVEEDRLGTRDRLSERAASRRYTEQRNNVGLSQKQQQSRSSTNNSMEINESIRARKRMELSGPQRETTTRPRDGVAHSAQWLSSQPLVDRGSCNEHSANSASQRQVQTAAPPAGHGARLSRKDVSPSGRSTLQSLRAERQHSRLDTGHLELSGATRTTSGATSNNSTTQLLSNNGDHLRLRRSMMAKSPPMMRGPATGPGAASTALNRSVSMRQQPVADSVEAPAAVGGTTHYRRIIHTPISTAAIRRQPGYEEEQDSLPEPRRERNSTLQRASSQDLQSRYSRPFVARHTKAHKTHKPVESDDSESPMTRTWANPSSATGGKLSKIAMGDLQAEVGAAPMDDYCSSELDVNDLLDGEQQFDLAEGGELNGPQMDDAYFQYQSENSSESTSLLDQNGANLDKRHGRRCHNNSSMKYHTNELLGAGRAQQQLDCHSQQRLNEIGLPDPEMQTRYTGLGSSSSHLGFAHMRSEPQQAASLGAARKMNAAMAPNDVETGFSSTEHRATTRPSFGGRAMSQQSLIRPTMPLARRLRRSGGAAATLGRTPVDHRDTCGVASDLGGSSVSLVSRLHDGSRYESAHTRSPVVMYIPRANRSATTSRHNSVSDLTGGDGGCRSATLRKSTRSRSVSKSRSSLTGLNLGLSLGAQARTRASSRQASDSETSSMLRTLVRPRGRPPAKNSSKVRRRSSSRRRTNAPNGSDAFDEDDDAIGQLATEIDTYKFTRRYSVPKDAKINWFSKLKQRVTSSASRNQ